MKRLLAPLFGLVFLVSCAGTTAEDYVADARLLIGTPVVSATCPAGPCGLTGAYLLFKTRYPAAVTPETDAAVQSDLAAATSTGGLIDQLAAAATAADKAADLRGIESVGVQVLSILANAAAKVPDMDRDITFDLQSVALFLPLLEQSANQLLPSKAVGAIFIPAKWSAPNVTIDQARARLRR